MSQKAGAGPISVWKILKWIVALTIAAIAIFPIWWMINVVFALPGEPVSLNPRLWPTSLSAGIANIHMIFAQTEFLGREERSGRSMRPLLSPHERNDRQPWLAITSRSAFASGSKLVYRYSSERTMFY
jgi:ABC-type glycerol-3-phosphate transport system permease component